MRKCLGALVAAALLISFAGSANAQVTTTGTITVVIQDKDGGRLPGVTVSAEAPDTITKRSAVTDETGTAVLEALAPSSQYRVSAMLSGFTDLTQEKIRVISGQSFNLPLTMQVAGLTETVSVVATTPLVDTTSAVTGQDITLELTDSLPTGRSYQSYLQLVPGVLPDDHLDTLASESSRRGGRDGPLDFSLLFDGLAAEREQGITIDVAYRYFATPRRSFIVADAPGH